MMVLFEDNMVTVSVVMTTYNHEAYISQAIESVLSQETLFRYELIVGNDASTDSTAKIIDEYAMRFPNILVNIDRKKTIGASANFYDLITRARGKYIAILDGDDFWCCKQKLQAQVDFLENNKDFIGCTHLCGMVDKFGNRLGLPQPKWITTRDDYSLDDFKGYILPGQPSTMVFHNIFNSPSHDYSIIRDAHPMIADRALVICLAANGRFKRINEEMSCYRVLDKDNATSVLYTQNRDCGLIDIDLSKRYERYLHKELGINRHFYGYRLKKRIKLVIKRLIPLSLLNKIRQGSHQ